MKKFHEHIVRIGALDFTREMLWQGLEESVRHPEKFIEHMDSASILSEEVKNDSIHLQRKIDFGTAVFLDTVILEKSKDTITTMVKPGNNWPASIFTIKIEEPEEGHLFVRFIYEEDSHPNELQNPMLLQIRRRAYEAKDKHLIDLIQELPSLRQ